MKTILVLIVVFLSFLKVEIALAHSMGEEGSIEVILHVDPNDKPIALQQTGFHIEINDEENEFKLENCDCRVIIFDKYTILYKYKNENEKANGVYSINFMYQIPKKGRYKVTVIGNPKGNAHFHPFETSFNINVDDEIVLNKNNIIDNKLNYFLLGIPLILLIVYFIKKINLLI